MFSIRFWFLLRNSLVVVRNLVLATIMSMKTFAKLFVSSTKGNIHTQLITTLKKLSSQLGREILEMGMFCSHLLHEP